jgi:hypothetical protein
MLSPSPQPPLLKGGGVLGPRNIKNIPETRYYQVVEKRVFMSS